MKRNLFALVLLTTFVFQSAFAQAPARAAAATTATTTAAAKAHALKILPVERKFAEGVTADQLKQYLYFVASDEMEGRDTPSRGLDTVAKFIALNLSRWGLKPAGDNGTYFQRIALQRLKLDPANTHAEINSQTFNFADDLLAQEAAGTTSAP